MSDPFGPGRVREAAIGPDWRVADVRYTSEDEPVHYEVTLEKV